MAAKRLLTLRLLTALLLMTAGSVVLLPAPSASAANIAFSQCNGFATGGTGGATTQMNCDIEVVNTINGPNRGSVVTVTRTCTGGTTNACPAGSNTGVGNTGPATTTSSDLITTVNQCNGSANDDAIMTPPIQCTVRITNNISADTPGAEPLGLATLNQCNGSNATAVNACDPATATTTDATVTQCNVSGEGGGGTVDCFFELNSDMTSPVSKVTTALPISINQCNGTGNPGGSYVTCEAFISTNITAAYGGTSGGTTAGTSATSAGAAAGTTSGGTGTTSGSTTSGTTGGGATTGSATSGTAGGGGDPGSVQGGGQVFPIPQGGVAAGSGPPASRLPAMVLGLLFLLTAGGLALRSRQRS